MTRLELQRRWAVAAFSVLAGAVIFWTALRSVGFDWFISETHADIIYSGLRRFREYPFFSFVVNGGSYFIQDPQSNLFSPAVPLIWLAGPTIGLRLNEAVVVGVGVYGFVVWMRTWVSTEAALVGAVASAMSLGVLWKVAVGNDMFMWHLGLPWLLWSGQQVIRQRNLRVAIVMGLWLGILLLGPTFHSFTYLFVPVALLYLVFELVRERPNLAEFGKTAALFALSLALALLIVSPKLACWLKFPMARPIGDHGVTTWWVVLRSLFDYGWVQREFIQTAYIDAHGTWLTGKWWGTEECAIAMPPLGSALALVGLVVALRAKSQRAFAGFAVVLLVCGVALACAWPVWSGFRWLTGGNFRVAQRFFGLSATGLVILASLGAEAVFARVPKYALPLASVMALFMLGSAMWWTRGASVGGEAALLEASAMNPVQVWSREKKQADGLDTFEDLVKFDSAERLILEGTGYKDGFMVVGNRFKRRLYKTKRTARRKHDRAEAIVVEGIDRSHVKVSHLGVTVQDLPANTRVRLRVMEPLYGVSTRTIPRDADVEVINRGAYLAIENFGDQPVSRVKLQVELPVWKGWFLISASVGIGALLTLSGDLFLKRKSGLAPVGAG